MILIFPENCECIIYKYKENPFLCNLAEQKARDFRDISVKAINA